jgi:hypothetical protein
MSANENQGSSDLTPKPDQTGNPSDVTPEPDVTPKPRRRDILAGMAFGLAGVPTVPVRDQARAAEVRRRCDDLLKVMEVDDDGTLQMERVCSAVGLAVIEYLGLDPEVSQICGVEYGDRFFVVEAQDFGGMSGAKFYATAWVVDRRLVARV